MMHHDHDHHHSHGHHHHHHHETPEPKELSFEEKLTTLLSHWIAHNESHKANYASWAEKATEAGLAEASALIGEAAEISGQITARLDKALALLKS